MSIGSIGYTGYTQYTASYIAKQASVSKSGFSGAVAGAETAAGTKKVTESAVDAFKKKHPDDAAHVNSQVKAGKKVLEKNGVTDVSREDMTMEEYKQFFTALMDSIPRDPSQRNDVEIWSITEKGWEQMKNDPDYEAWVLGYTVENRSVYIPFASWPGYSPCLCTEKFGDSIEQHIGQSVPMNTGGSKKTNSSDEESWWVKRQKRLKELLEEQQKRARQQRALERNAMEEAMLQEQMASSARLKNFLTDGVTGDEEIAFQTGHFSAAVSTYESIMDLFSNSVAGGKI